MVLARLERCLLGLHRKLAAEIQAIKDAEVAAAEAELKRQEGRKRREVGLTSFASPGSCS